MSARARRLALAVAAVLGLALFLLLGAVYDQGVVADVDGAASDWVVAEVPGWVEWLARPFSWLGGWIGLTAVGVVTCLLVLRSGDRTGLWFFVAAYPVGQVVANATKAVYDRPRPSTGSPIPLPESSAYPSGHAAAVTCVGTVAVLAAERLPPGRGRRAVLGLAAGLGLAIGVSRVLLNVHWVSDVVGGWAFGLAWLAGCLLARDLIRRRRDRLTG